MTKKTARFIRKLDDFKGDARLYQISEPITYPAWREADDPRQETEYVVVSAVYATFTGPETYIFPSDEKGNVLAWGELEGSFRGSYDHQKALQGLGFELE